ncbi:unnamed protein product [Kuraishia capsulata CBS 1993]|uniref:GAT domain-containing protein n=1 Tax=Kuraishia capsulata CBS 1993 TaxID=1382522 RepID=W6MFL1_9ASCO|nr:uncharacterized protein KUCA_T00000585001 [Kuraishia capsulata CBS 1993]CDK24619.1 unnamed protein product [Kuraishia capsulata CBS 1993]
MHRLLAQKGYAFPEVKREDAAVLNPSDNLKSIDEIQKEERVAQSAKLQELIRRGRPQDLREANKLMKIMSGFQDDKVLENTKQRVADDIERVKRKAEIFNEMLTTASNAGRLDPTDETIAELYASLKVAQPKIQTIIQEEQGDETAVTSMLGLNDMINSLLERYNFLKNGDLANASKVKVGGGGLNLIDFDDDEPSDSAATPNATGGAFDPVADLLGELGSLSFSNNTSNSNNNGSSSLNNDLLNFGAGGSITLSSPGNTQTASPREQSPNIDSLFSLGGTATTVQPAVQSAIQPAAATQNKGLDPFSMDFSSLSSPFPAPQQASRHFINQSANLKIEFQISSTTPLTAKIYFSSLALAPISNLQFLIAVPKSYELTLAPQSGNYLAPMTSDGITQDIKVTKKVNDGVASSVKIKWKCDYTVNGANQAETGVTLLTSN